MLSERLEQFPITREALRAAHPDITDLICGAFIFAQENISKSESHDAIAHDKAQNQLSPATRVLLLQRSASQPANRNPNVWDFTGGRFETSDSDIIAAVAREVKEESGFTLSKVVEFVDIVTWTKGPEFEGRKWGKFCFIVEVDEIENRPQGSDLSSVSVKLSPDEHQAYEWASEEAVKKGKFDMIGAEKETIVLQAFEKYAKL